MIKKHTNNNSIYTRYAHKRVSQLIVLIMAALFVIIQNHGSDWTWFRSLNDNFQITIQCAPIIIALVVFAITEIKN